MLTGIGHAGVRGAGVAIISAVAISPTATCHGCKSAHSVSAGIGGASVSVVARSVSGATARSDAFGRRNRIIDNELGAPARVPDFA